MTRRSCVLFASCVSLRVLRGQNQPALAASATRGSSTINYSLVGQRVPIWSGGSLVLVEGGLDKGERDDSFSALPVRIRVFDRQAKEILNAPFVAPGASHTYLNDWARALDGWVVTCGVTAQSDRSLSPFFARISKQGRPEILRLQRYTPYRIAAGGDGTIWMVGYETVNGAETGPGVKVDEKGGVVRCFDRSGRMLRSFLPRSGISDITRVRRGLLASSPDRIGWYGSGNDGKGAYVEISDGGVLREYPLIDAPAADRLMGFVLTDANLALAATSRQDGRLSFYLLDREARQWRSVRQPESLVAARGTRLWGVDGNDLVFGMPDRGKILIRFYRLSA